MSVLSLANSSLSIATPLLAHGTFLGSTQSALFEPLAVMPTGHLGYEDPSERLKVMITGGGTASGGVATLVSNPFSTIFPGGVRPNSASIVDEVVNVHGILPTLQGGKVYIWLEDVAGSPLPRFHAIAAMPVLHSQLYGRLANFADWAQWMPGIESSKNLTSPLQKPQVQELVIGTPVGRKLYSQNLVSTEFLSGGEQVHWTLQGRDKYKVPTGHTGFTTNEGSWTITRVPGQGTWSLVAYQTHFVPNMPDWALAAFKLAIMGQVRDEFASLMLALANRTRDPNWTAAAGTNPSNMSYKIEQLR